MIEKRAVELRELPFMQPREIDTGDFAAERMGQTAQL
jgi:hypothetical protein